MPLPTAVSVDLRLSTGATVAALDASIWSGVARLSEPVEEFLLRLVGGHGARYLRIMADPWPPGIRPDQVPWPTRVGGALRAGGLLAPERLERLTYGELLALRATGRKSALELGVIVDALAAPPTGPLGDIAREALEELSKEPWIARIGGEDRRFRDLLPPYGGRLDEMLDEALDHPDGRLARALVHAVPAIRHRAEEIGCDPLELALVRLGVAFGVSERHLAISAARPNRSAGRQRKLQEVGDEFSMSKERVRQIADQTEERIGRAYLPQLERAARLLAARVPITAGDGARLLVEQGLSSEPVDPSVIESLADLMGYEVGFRVDGSAGVPLVVPAGPTVGGAVMTTARRLAHRDGISNIGPLAAAMEADGSPFPPEVAALVLRTSPEVALLDDEWFWVPSVRPGRNGVDNATRRMLAVSPRLEVAAVRRGLVRLCHGIRVADVPPVGVLARFYAAHPEFVLGPGTVESAVSIDPRAVLTPAELALVETLRASTGGWLRRAELEEGVTGRGVGLRHLNSLITYTPILDHPGRDVWRLRA